MKQTRANLHLAGGKFATIFGEGPDGGEVIRGVLSNFYKMETAAIDAILTDGATPESILTAITNADKARVKKLTEQLGKDKFQEGYKKAKAEERTAAEAELKAHYGIESDKTGVDLVEEIAAAKAKESGATEADIKNSPTYKQLEASLKKQLNDLTNTHKVEVKKITDGYAKEQVFSEVGKTALNQLNELNPVLPTNAVVAETMRTNFINALKANEYVKAGDTYTVLNSDGTPATDEHGNAVTYEDHIKKIAATHFEFTANSGGEGANQSEAAKKAAADKAAAAGYPAGVTRPKNATDLAATLKKLTKPSDKRIVMDEYNKEFSKGQ